ncbi:hypothetical protein HK405_002900 [Cladochytrium tenue]|nr:hypothetical protein HK405_002900 [Cladochytrium tenue]
MPRRDSLRALREALRQHHGNARIWENFLYVSMDVGELADTVLAMRNIFELRTSSRSDNGSATGDKLERAYDFAVLRAVVESVMAGDELPSGTSARTLATPVEQLLERFTDGAAGGSAAGGPQVADLFSLRAEFALWRGRAGESLEFRQRAYRAVLHSPALAGEYGAFERAAAAARALAEAYATCGPREAETRNDGSDAGALVCADWRYQRRTMLKTLVSRTKVNGLAGSVNVAGR